MNKLLILFFTLLFGVPGALNIFGMEVNDADEIALMASKEELATDEQIANKWLKKITRMSEEFDLNAPETIVGDNGQRLVRVERNGHKEKIITVLGLAVESGSLAMVRLLISKGALVNDDLVLSAMQRIKTSKQKRTGIITAQAILQELLKQATCTHRVLEQALIEQDLELVKALVTDNQLSVTTTDIARAACEQSGKEPNSHIICYLMDHADIKPVLTQFNTTWRPALTMVEFLLQLGADVNAADDNGETFIFKAIRECDSEMVALLIKYNANVNQPTNKNFVALDLVNWLLANPSYCVSEKRSLDNVKDRLQKIKELLIENGAYSQQISTKPENNKCLVM